MKDYRINYDEIPFSVPPYSYEYVGERAYGKWRLKDSKDDAVGSAEDEESAKIAVEKLNKYIRSL